MHETDFWNSEYWVVANRITAYMDREDRAWQKYSYLAYYMLMPYMKKGRNLSPQKLAPWAWNGGINNSPKRLTAEEERERFAKEDEYMRRKYG